MYKNKYKAILMNNIIHAGGEIDGNHYSNSYEAIIENIKKK